MRNWYSIDFTPTSVMNKNRYYNKEEIIKDLQSCGESLNRIIEFTKENYSDTFYYNHHAVLQEDIVNIIKLKRELNKIYRKLEWKYIRSEG